MTQIEKFNDTVSILVKAYLNDTLEHSNYCGCAVGNILAHHVGAELIDTHKPEGRRFRWNHKKYYGGEWYCAPRVGDVNHLVKESGYSFDDIYKIEKAFEGASRIGDWMFNGLVAVVDVLAEIHSVDLTAKENAKLLFVK